MNLAIGMIYSHCFARNCLHQTSSYSLNRAQTQEDKRTGILKMRITYYGSFSKIIRPEGATPHMASLKDQCGPTSCCSSVLVKKKKRRPHIWMRKWSGDESTGMSILVGTGAEIQMLACV